MPVYKIKGKRIMRASIVATQMGVAADGTPQIVQQPGPMERLEVGTLLYNVRPDELAAFGDRLDLLSDEDVVAEEAAQKARDEARRPATAQVPVAVEEQVTIEADQVAEAKEAEAPQTAKAEDEPPAHGRRRS